MKVVISAADRNKEPILQLLKKVLEPLGGGEGGLKVRGRRREEECGGVTGEGGR